jgi:NAD(P)-dependent dehydrogenase (short-subunit alcohol dehydrogenase family)
MKLIERKFGRRSLIASSMAGMAALALGPAGAQSPGGAAGGLRGRTALVTGSTDGLGREVARRLGALGADVIVHGRNRERGAEVVREIESGGGGDAVFYRADFGSLDEVAALVTAIKENHGSLSLLINNAGIWTEGDDERRTSADGHELIFAVNYLAPYVLCHELKPLLERGAPSRIVNVSSIAQQPIDFDDVMLTQGFSASRAYAQSKLALVMLTLDLAAELAGDRVTANALHPATLMDTTMVEKAGARPMTTVDDGANAVMQLAVSSELAGGTGLYYNSMNEARANAQAYDEAARARLRALSRELTGVG